MLYSGENIERGVSVLRVILDEDERANISAVTNAVPNSVYFAKQSTLGING